jgi:hypothetical protein
MAIAGETTITAGDQLRSLAWTLRHVIKGLAVIVALMAALIVGMFVATGEIDLGWNLLFVLAACTLMPGFVLLSHSRLAEAQKQITLTIDDDAVVIRDGLGAAVNIPWSMVKRCVETRGAFAIVLRPAGHRWLPKRAFTAEALGELKSLLHQKLGDAARLRA